MPELENKQLKKAERLNHHKVVLPRHSFEGGFAHADGVGKFWVDFDSPFTKAPSTVIFPIGLYELPIVGVKVPVPIILRRVNKNGFEFWAPAVGGVDVPYIAFGTGGCK